MRLEGKAVRCKCSYCSFCLLQDSPTVKVVGTNGDMVVILCQVSVWCWSSFIAKIPVLQVSKRLAKASVSGEEESEETLLSHEVMKLLSPRQPCHFFSEVRN